MVSAIKVPMLSLTMVGAPKMGENMHSGVALSFLLLSAPEV